MKTNEIKAVFYEAGHGFNGDNGAVANGTTERAHTIDIAKMCGMFHTQVTEFAKVKFYLIGVDEQISLYNKIKKINQICKANGYDGTNSILVSIHVNSGGKGKASGVEGWFYSGSLASEDLATTITTAQKELLQIPQRSSRGDMSNRHGRLGIVRDTKPLACLIECGFIDNINDANLLKNPETEKKFAQGIVRGIKRYLGIK